MCKKTNQKAKTKNQSTISPSDGSFFLEQIKYLHSEKCAIQNSFLSIISFSLGAYGIVIYHAFEYESKYPDAVNYMFIILPFLFSLSFYNIIKYTIRMLGLSEYIRHLEKTINNIHDDNKLFQWESKLIQANGWGIIGGIAQIPCYSAMAILLGFKFWENINRSEVRPWLRISLIVSLIVTILTLIGLLCLCLREKRTVRKKIEPLHVGADKLIN